MDALNFYYSISLLLKRGRFNSDLQTGQLDAESPEEKSRRKWLNKTLDALEYLTDSEISRDSQFFFDLNRLDQSLRENILKDWEAFRKDFPIAGLRFSKGRASTFAAKIMDDESLENMEAFYRQKDKEFREFADNYTLALARNANTVISFCFGFQDKVKLEKAREHFKKVKVNKKFFTVNYSELWFYDLKNEVLHLPEGFAAKSRSAADSFTHSWGKRLSINKKEESLDNWSHKGGMFSMTTIGPATFREFMSLYKAAIKKGELSIPPEFLDQMKTENNRFEKIQHQMRLRKIEEELRGIFKKIGESLLNEKNDVGEIMALKEEFQSALQEKREIELLGAKINSLKDYRKNWQASTEKEAKLNSDRAKLAEEFREQAKEFAKGLFEHDKTFILSNPELNTDFSALFRLEKIIEERNKEIEELKVRPGNLIQQAKFQTRILYLKGLNEKDQWEKRKYWRPAGEYAFSHIQNFPASSHNFSLWDRMKKNQLRTKTLLKHLEEEKQKQHKWEQEVRGLFPGLDSDTYPWQVCQQKAQSQLDKLKQSQEKRLVQIGETYRLHSPDVEIALPDQMGQIKKLEQERKEIQAQLKL